MDVIISFSMIKKKYNLSSIKYKNYYYLHYLHEVDYSRLFARHDVKELQVSSKSEVLEFSYYLKTSDLSQKVFTLNTPKTSHI